MIVSITRSAIEIMVLMCTIMLCYLYVRVRSFCSFAMHLYIQNSKQSCMLDSTNGYLMGVYHRNAFML